jgi:hypothetical protein
MESGARRWVTRQYSLSAASGNDVLSVRKVCGSDWSEIEMVTNSDV